MLIAPNLPFYLTVMEPEHKKVAWFYRAREVSLVLLCSGFYKSPLNVHIFHVARLVCGKGRRELSSSRAKICLPVNLFLFISKNWDTGIPTAEVDVWFLLNDE